MMNFELALMAYALYLLIWEKLPEWGTWFNQIIAHLPRVLQKLYADWRCPYCSGFWIALALHALTGLQTLPQLTSMPDYLGMFAAPLAWFLDALATSALVLITHLAVSALSGPAIRGHKILAEFKASMAAEKK